MMGRVPGPDDLIVPLPPDAAEHRLAPRRTVPVEGLFEHAMRYKDLPALRWWHRRHYDMRVTFITLATEDGTRPDVIETRVTHSRKARNVFDGYNRGHHWERTCAEISKLRIRRGLQSTAIEQPLPASGGPEPLPFRCSPCKCRKPWKNLATLGMQPRRHTHADSEPRQYRTSAREFPGVIYRASSPPLPHWP